MNADAKGAAGFERRVVPVVVADADGTLGLDLAQFPGAIAVNVLDADGHAALISPASLDAVLAMRPAAVTIDTVALSHYQSLVTGKANQALATAANVRGQLRSHETTEVTAQIDALIRILRELVLLLSVYLIQREDQEVSRAVRVLMQQTEQCATSAFQLEDPVRCMDDIHYDIVPTISRCLSWLSSVR